MEGTPLKRISTERVVSGPAILQLYQFFKQRTPESAVLPDDVTSHTHGIVSHAIEGKDELCKKVVDYFLYHYGSECGDVCLKLNPKGGIYLLGGVTLALKDYILGNATFLEGFYNKGRVTDIIRDIPIYVLTREIGLDGAEMFGV